MDLSGKTALVTGATSGIGLETAAELAGRGATVILGVRNLDAAEQVKKDICQRFPGAKVDVGPSLDLISQDSVRAFAATINKKYPKLHILVNNAGVAFLKKEFTSDKVGVIAQTNHLGPYTLTRLLEDKLIKSQARVVTVASVTHRRVRIKDAMAFLTDFRSGFYEHTKHANVLFGYELQRRLGNKGVQSCVADPGGVRSAIWDKSPMSKKGSITRWLIDACFSPPTDGAQSLIHAATVEWDKERREVKGKPVEPSEDLRYYSRGLFCSPLLTNMQGLATKGLLSKVTCTIWEINALICGFLDWPLRKFTGLGSKCVPVRSSAASYDKKISADLWNASADVAKVPREVA